MCLRREKVEATNSGRYLKEDPSKMYYYTRAHVLHDVNTFRMRTCKYRSKRKSCNGRERSVNILQFESPLSTSERLPKLIEGSKNVDMFEMIFKQTREVFSEIAIIG